MNVPKVVQQWIEMSARLRGRQLRIDHASIVLPRVSLSPEGAEARRYEARDDGADRFVVSVGVAVEYVAAPVLVTLESRGELLELGSTDFWSRPLGIELARVSLLELPVPVHVPPGESLAVLVKSLHEFQLRADVQLSVLTVAVADREVGK